MLPFRKILVATDFSDAAHAGLRVAAALRARGPRDAELTLVHAVEPIASLPFYAGAGPIADLPIKAQKAAYEELERIATEAVPLCESLRAEVHVGRTADVVLEVAERLPADLVVLGTHGRTGFRRLLFGSVAGEVLRRSRRATLVVPERFAASATTPAPADEKGYARIERILVPTDFSDGARAGLDLGLRIAAAFGAELHLFHVVDSRSGDALEPLLGDHQTNVKNLLVRAEKAAEAALVREKERAGGEARGVTTREHVRLGAPAHEVAEFVGGYGIDLIVMGSRGRTGVGDFLLGSTAERIGRLSPVPVLAARQP